MRSPSLAPALIRRMWGCHASTTSQHFSSDGCSALIRAAFNISISTTTLTSSPSGSTAGNQKRGGCSFTGSLTKPSPSGRPHTTPSSANPLSTGSERDTLLRTYNNLLNHMGDDEAVLFGDAVHPTHAVRPVGCWAPKDIQLAVPQTSGRQRLNIHGAIDLETGKTRMIEAATVNAMSTVMLLMAIEAMYPGKRLIHLFVDNARYHHARLVQAWLARPECRIKLHF